MSFETSSIFFVQVLKRAGPEEHNDLNLRVSKCVAPVVFGRLH